MKNKTIAVLLIILTALKGQATPVLETLYGDFIDETGINIQVFSGGCTDKESFVFRKEYSRGVEHIYFYRIKPDLCKAFFKYGKFVNFTYKDLGLKKFDRFRIGNPRINPGTSHARQFLEPLYGHFFNENGVVIQVYSGGCTYKGSFVTHNELLGGVMHISFYRTKADFCEAYMRYGKFIYFSYEELGLQVFDRFKILNPRIAPRLVQ